MNSQKQVFLGFDNSYQDSQIVLFGAPYDGTTSYRPGARFGPSAIRNESYGIETYSPYQDADLLDMACFDAGDLELPIGDSRLVLEKIEAFSQKIYQDGKIPFMLGGEHLVTLGSVRAAVKQYPDLNIIQFDAHADLRDDYLGVKLSHACVIRRCHELLGNGKIYQFGIRSGDRDEFRWGMGKIYTKLFDFQTLAETVDKLSGKPVYFTLDLDVLDPGIFPGTGTPEAGGISFLDLYEALRLVSKAQVIGLDMNELSPLLDQSGASTALACKLVREIALMLRR